jgi:hypothetical protein
MTALLRAALVLLLTAGVSLGAHAQVNAQVPRKFTQYTLRGAIVFGEYPMVRLNGQSVRLAPGSRVRNQNNVIVAAATLRGARVLANYTLDLSGTQVRDIWILRPGEAAVSPWPVTLQEAQSWTFNDTAQTWTPP